MQMYFESSTSGKGVWIPFPQKDLNKLYDYIFEYNLADYAEGEEFRFTEVDFDSELVLDLEVRYNVIELNSLLLQYEQLKPHKQRIVLALLEVIGNTVNEFSVALSSLDKMELKENVHNEYELGQSIVSTLKELTSPSSINPNLDYKRLGRDAIKGKAYILTTYGALHRKALYERKGKK